MCKGSTLSPTLSLRTARGRLKAFSFALALFLLHGCALADHAPGTQPTTTTTLTTLRLADALPAAHVRDPGQEIDLTNKITFGSRTIFFGQLDTFDVNDDDLRATVPLIAIRKEGQRYILPVRDARLVNAAWNLVVQGPAKEEIFGVLDASLDDDQADLLLLHSTDAGETWTVTALHKPDPAADFDSICMSKDGKGRATVLLSNDGKRQNGGFYHYRTTDGGKTWSTEPDREPDALKSADETTDEDNADDAPKTQRASVPEVERPSRPPRTAAGTAALQHHG